MTDSNKTPDELIKQVIAFLEKEREMYGDFSVQSFKKSSQNETQASKANQQLETAKNQPSHQKDNTIAEPSSPEKNGTSPSTDSGFDSPNVYNQIDKCNSLDELETLCRKTDVLRTDLEGTQLVFGVGNPHADLMLIGEAPGAEEDKQGEPFVGKAGQLLNQILEAINFSREDVYIANILKHRPPNNRNPNSEERRRSLPFLLRQIDLVNPKLILALGKVSAQTLLDNNLSLTKMRGKFHKFQKKYELLATYHPAALLRHAKWKRPTWEDVQLLRKRYDELGCTP